MALPDHPGPAAIPEAPMSLTLHSHSLASFCWKVLIALHDTGTPFRAELVDFSDPGSQARLLDRALPPAPASLQRREHALHGAKADRQPRASMQRATSRSKLF